MCSEVDLGFTHHRAGSEGVGVGVGGRGGRGGGGEQVFKCQLQ